MSYSEFLDVLDPSSNVWDEQPVPLEEFIYSEEFLNHPPLSEIQMDITHSMSQILRKETLDELYDEKTANHLWSITKKDLFLLLSKGSGKNTITQIAFLYIIYQLLCMRSPQEYYGKPLDDNIDIVNMATNARQAVNGFFNKFKAMVKSCQWFNGKWQERTNDLRFDKFVTLHSLHSRPESAEALNIIACCLDEIDSPDLDGEEMFNYLSGTVTSRYPLLGKVACLSFARSADGFIMTRYNDSVAEKIVHEYNHTYKLNNDLPDGIEENEFTIRWTEDEVISYKYDNVLALKYPAYRVNPMMELENYKMPCYQNFDDAMMRFFAVAPNAENDAFFKNHPKLEAAMSNHNGWNKHTQEIEIPNEYTHQYYVHVDLAKKIDRAAIAMGHVDRYVAIDLGAQQLSPSPVVKIDLLRYWAPTQTQEVDFAEIRDFIIELNKRFNIRKVTFDQWGAHQMVEHLIAAGVNAEKLSLSIPEYTELRLTIGEQRLEGPEDDELMKEMKNLIVNNVGKVDHKPGYHNDLTEALCGATVHCVRSATGMAEVEVLTMADLNEKMRASEHYHDALASERYSAGRKMPGEMQSFIDQLYALNGE